MNKDDVQLVNEVSDYWMKYFVHNGHCSLCGNSGVVDTTGVQTAVGVPCGRRNFCICPNGQAYRAQRGTDVP